MLLHFEQNAPQAELSFFPYRNKIPKVCERVTPEINLW